MIQDFYAQKTILLTGATGFLGKVVLEKILRSLPNIKAVYISVTPKPASGATEYSRFHQEIVESQIFDKLKQQLGIKGFNKLISDKVRTLPIDLMRENLGISEKQRGEITSQLNIIINCAANTDLEARLEIAVRSNVGGPLKLLKLAEECPNFVSLLQVSTAFVNCDRNGFLEEIIYDSKVNWSEEFRRVLGMTGRDLEQNLKKILDVYPNAAVYSKRMAEHLLIQNNQKKIPIIFIRPSAIGTAANEPMPGWTDSMGLVTGTSLQVGLGILRDMRGNGNLVADIVPVDFVARHLLVSIPFSVSQGQKQFISHCTTSVVNPCTWNNFFDGVVKYQNMFPYAKRAGNAQLVFHSSKQKYAFSYNFKNKLPTNTYFYLSKVFGSKQTKNSMAQIRKAVNDCEKIATKFEFFTNHEWLHDNAQALKMQIMLKNADPQQSFDVDLSKLDWKNYSMNFGYGIKNYILKEESFLPSVGYNDVVIRMVNKRGRDLLPWSKQGMPAQVRSREEIIKLLLANHNVKEEMAKLVKEKLAYYRGTLHQEIQEDKVYREVEKLTIQNIMTIASNYNHSALKWMAQVMKIVFTTVYDKIVVNEQALKRVRQLCAQRRGPVIFVPTHRSYVDFLLVSCVLYFYNMEVPHICAGEDLMQITGVSHLLRMSGAFFMRRTFRGDPLYKAIFTGYVEQLVSDKVMMEFFIEGTRSRTNKMLTPKFGILQILTNCFFDKKVEQITFVPVTINYSRTLEGESFPNELTGENKVKESLSRIVSAIQIFAMNFGTILLDFYEPITMTQAVANAQKISPQLDPFKNKQDRITFNDQLGHKIVYILQDHIRIMPPTLVASIVLLYRKGISEDQLAKKIAWLGMILNQRGAIVATDSGLPSSNTLNIGLKHLNDYIQLKRNYYLPKIVNGSYHNYIMLGYYRNPINFVFFNESIVVCAINSFGAEQAWKNGIPYEDVFSRACYLSELLKREEVLKERIKPGNKQLFDKLISFMQEQRILAINPENKSISLKGTGEATLLFIGSICWPMIDTYYVTLLFALSMVKQKNILDSNFPKDVQWLAETLFLENKLYYFEACNQPAITNAKSALLEMKIFKKNGVFINLHEDYLKQEGEKRILKAIDFLGQFRMTPASSNLLFNIDSSTDIRRSLFTEFPIMSKL